MSTGQNFKAWIVAHKALAIFIAVVLIVGIVLAIVLPLTAGNIFRAANVAKINFGDEHAQVEKILGKPNVEKETSYQYYSKNIVKKMQQLANLENNIADLLMSDKEVDENTLENLLNKAADLSAEIETMEYKQITVEFSEGGVSSVILDTNVNGDTSGKTKWQENAKKQKIELSPKEIPSDFTPEMLYLAAQIYYADGSYKMSRISPNYESSHRGYDLSWSDNWGEYSAKLTEGYSDMVKGSNYKIINVGSGKRVLQIIQSVYESNSYAWNKYANDIVAVYVDTYVDYIARNAFDSLTKVDFKHYENGIYLSGLSNPYQFLWQTETTDFTTFNFHFSTKTILGKAFSDCENLTDITIPNGVTSLGWNAFYNCPNLENIQLSNSTRYIATNVFNECPKIKYNELEGAKYLASSTNDYYALVEVSADATTFTLPANCKLIFSNALSKCDKLETIYWNATRCAISGAKSSVYPYEHCTNLTSIVIGNTVEEIAAFTFWGYKGAISWEENSTITTIGENAFSGYRGTSLIIPDSVRIIEQYAFSICSNLTSVVLGSGLKYIDRKAFNSCDKVTSVIFANPYKWGHGTARNNMNGTFSESELSNPATAAEYLTKTYLNDYWTYCR